MDTTSGIRTAYPSEEPNFIPVFFCRIGIVQSLVFFYLSYFGTIFFVLRFAASDYLFDIFDLRLLITPLISSIYGF